MVDCFRCYRLQRMGNKVYCPFIDLPECHRGKHAFVHPKPEDVNRTQKPSKKVLQFSSSAKIGAGYKHRKFIIDAVIQGATYADIAEELHITECAVEGFVVRMMDRNHISCISDLVNWIVE